MSLLSLNGGTSQLEHPSLVHVNIPSQHGRVPTAGSQQYKKQHQQPVQKTASAGITPGQLTGGEQQAAAGFVGVDRSALQGKQ